MTPTTQVFEYLSLGLLVFGFGLFVYLLALTPADEAPDVGVKGLKRKAVLEEGGLFNTIEPLMRWLARRIAGLPLHSTRASINTQLRQAGEYLGLTADEYLALCVLSTLGMLVAGVVIDQLCQHRRHLPADVYRLWHHPAAHAGERRDRAPLQAGQPWPSVLD
jgi:hypothetical protein